MDEKLYQYMDWPRIEAVAVSYTHLDVYKRQVIYRADYLSSL